ncbi:response regulator [Ectothiorhodospiraceae bacterium BW-2]|nr:response regulator [Ectothiorhodospiraceae bacterium BW-2]
MSTSSKILVVDDESRNLHLLRQILKDQYTLMFAKSGSEAIHNALEQQPDLILLDVMMPEMDGFTVCDRLKHDHRTSEIGIIFVTALDDIGDEARGFELGAVDYITKPLRPAIVRRRVETHLALLQQQQQCRQQLRNQHHELRDTRFKSLIMLGKAAEFKDNETGMHVQRMSRYSELLARVSGWNSDSCELMLNAAAMHDIGKIGIPDHILQKPGRLTAEEFAVIQEHPQIGAEIIEQVGSDSELFAMAKNIALTHHEKWNGKGYPRQLAAEAIPLEGRIVAVADVFDALTTRRPYKEPWPLEKAVELLQDQAGEHFDPQLVKRLLDHLPEVIEIRSRWIEGVER